tara:strand:+ start:559 stop:4047 length:3489 start_codon:yes stop_codon:yes gene_type:complete
MTTIKNGKILLQDNSLDRKRLHDALKYYKLYPGSLTSGSGYKLDPNEFEFLKDPEKYVFEKEPYTSQSNDDCCEEVQSLINQVNNLQSDNAILQSQVDSSLGGILQSGATYDSYGDGIITEVIEGISYEQISTSYFSLLNQYQELYDEYVYATTLCIENATENGNGQNFFGINLNTLLPFWMEPGGQGSDGGQGYSPADLTPYFFDSYENTPNTLPWIWPEAFNPDNLTVDGTVLNDVIQQYITLLNNPLATINVTYEGLSPEYVNQYYANVLSALQTEVALITEQNLVLFEENEYFEELTLEMNGQITSLIGQLQAAVSQNDIIQLDLTELQSLYNQLVIDFNVVNDGITQETLDSLSNYYANELNTANSNYAQLQSINEEITELINATASENDELNDAITEAENALTNADQTIATLENSLQDVLTMWNEGAIQNQQDLAELYEDNQLLIEDLIDLQSEISDLNLTNTSLDSANNQLSLLNTSLQQTNTELLSQIENVGLALDTQLGQNEELTLILDALNIAYSDLQNDLTAAGVSIETAQEYLNLASSMISEYEEQATIDAQSLENLQSELELLQSQMLNDYVPLTQYNELVEDLESIIPEDGITQETLDAALLAAENSYNSEMQYSEEDYQSSLNLLNASIADLETNLENALLNQEDGVSQSDVDAMESFMQGIIDNIVPEDGISQADVDLLEQSLLELQQSSGSEIENLDAQLQTANSSLMAANAENAVLQSNIEELSSTNSLLQSQLAAVVPEDGVSQADVDNAISAAAQDCQTQLDVLQAQLNIANSNQEDGIGQDQIDIITQALEAEINALNNLLDAQSGTLSGQAESILELENSLSDLNDLYENLIPEDGITQSNLDAVEEDLDSAYLQIDLLDATILTLQNEIQGYAQESNDDSIEFAQLQGTYGDLSNSYLDLQQDYNNLDDAFNQIIPEDGISQADVDLVQASLLEAQQGLSLAENNLALLQSQFESLQSDTSAVDSLNSTIEELELQILNLNAEVEYYDDGINAASLIQLQNTITNLQNELLTIIPDDGIGQAELNDSYEVGFLQGQNDVLQEFDGSELTGASGIFYGMWAAITNDPETYCSGLGYNSQSIVNQEESFNKYNKKLVSQVSELFNYVSKLEAQLGIKPSNLDSIKPDIITGGNKPKSIKKY